MSNNEKEEGIEAETSGNADELEIPPSCFLGRTANEWNTHGWSLLGDSVTIGIGAWGWNKCDAISLLPLWCILFGSVQLLVVLLGLVFRFDLRRDQGEEKLGFPKAVTDILGISTIGLTVWGAVLTFPEFLQLDSDECSPPVYWTGFVGSAIALLVMTGMLGYYAYKAVSKKGGQNENVETGNEG